MYSCSSNSRKADWVCHCDLRQQSSSLHVMETCCSETSGKLVTADEPTVWTEQFVFGVHAFLFGSYFESLVLNTCCIIRDFSCFFSAPTLHEIRPLPLPSITFSILSLTELCLDTLNTTHNTDAILNKP